MKKLFFAALFAVVAIGGAVASNSKTLSLAPPYFDANGIEVDCTGSIHSCADLTLYSVQNPEEQNETNQIPPTELEELSRN